MPRRDLDRIRELLILAVEMPSEYDDGFVHLKDELIPHDTYQLYLMADAGLISGRSAKEGMFFITNAGHDFYEASKQKDIWEKTKAQIAHAGGATLGVAVDIAVMLLKEKVMRVFSGDT